MRCIGSNFGGMRRGVELGSIAQRVIPADRDQVFDAESRKVGKHLGGEVPGLGRDAVFAL